MTIAIIRLLTGPLRLISQTYPGLAITRADSGGRRRGSFSGLQQKQQHQSISGLNLFTFTCRAIDRGR